MVNNNKKTSGFTIVELIIVIAVIGILAAILIPTFSNVIEKANEKSATSDARNALTLYLSEKTEKSQAITDTLFFVEIAKKMYLFGYSAEEGELVPDSKNPYDVNEFITKGSGSMEATVTEFVSKLAEKGRIEAVNTTPRNEAVTDLAGNICVWSGYSLIVLQEGATDHTVTAYVTISSEGELVLTNSKVLVYDIDADGMLTVNDTLILAHKKNYPEGKSGFDIEISQWGIGISKLWGVANGGSYGYYINNSSAWSLTDPITDNDYLYAFSYEDAAAYSDSFSYFDRNAAAVTTGESITLTLNYLSGYDASYNPIFAPLSEATITINGSVTSYTTNAEGSVTIPMSSEGYFVISAVTSKPEIAHLVPPCFVATVSDN